VITSEEFLAAWMRNVRDGAPTDTCRRLEMELPPAGVAVRALEPAGDLTVEQKIAVAFSMGVCVGVEAERYRVAGEARARRAMQHAAEEGIALPVEGVLLNRSQRRRRQRRKR
jgi:hypothetical protein